jgi:3-oxoacyl-[acyl-carrier-protein] synthase III
MRVEIERIEYYLPSNVEDAAALKTDNPDWRIDDVEKKTGISKRYISSKGETCLDLAAQSAEKLFSSGVERAGITALIFVTQSPDYALPTSACILQNRLGLKASCLSFDMNLGCSGFVYGLAVSGSLIESGVTKNVLFLCGDTYSKYIDKHDRVCRPIFSDGAAATFIRASSSGRLGPFELGTDGSGFRNLIVENSGARGDGPLPGTLHMDGAKVFMFTMAKVPECVYALLAKANKKIEDIDLYIFHQASTVVLENIMRHLELPPEKVFLNLQRIGNTVSASIPMALKDAVDAGRLQSGDLVMLVGFGVGYSWGACLVKWGTGS